MIGKLTKHTAIAFAAAVSAAGGSYLQALEPPRSWSFPAGKREAAMRGMDGSSVILQAADGRAAAFPLAQLSDDDRAYVRARIGALALKHLEAATAQPVIAALGSSVPMIPGKSGWRERLVVNPAQRSVTPVSPAADGRASAFHSQHFAFSAGEPLPPAAMRSLAVFCEAVYDLHRTAPWGVLAGPGKEGRLEIKLDREAAALDGGRSEDACGFDPKTGMVSASFRSAGLRQVDGEWMRDESPHSGRALCGAISYQLLSDAAGFVPSWVVPGMMECVSHVPIVEGTAWPGGEIERLQAAASAGEPVEAVEFAKLFPEAPKPRSRGPAAAIKAGIPLPPVQPLPAPPPGPTAEEKAQMARQKAGPLLAYYFMRLEGGGRAEKLVALLNAAREESAKWRAYDEAVARYQKAWAEFKKNPEVIDEGNGRYRFPGYMTPPEAPRAPRPNITDAGQLRGLHTGLLLGSQSPAEAANAAAEALKKAGIQP